ncbi:unnamed protein product [Rotaria socialis]|uniref:Uncharacterized protein n=1 Tax=Rotaria socialis TaxID=392032 RepID=A0A818GIF4_9BILA|nr:unnamed protein product [Rotaria socialis]CAF4853102.1 unnamed protein product [Rotaria socialis]
MSYEEIDKDAYGTDVFTNGAEGRYSKPKSVASNDTTEKKRAPKAPTSTTDEQPYENGHSDGVVKTKKKIRKVGENIEIQNEYETVQIDPAVDGETVVKTKKKRAPKVQAESENFDPMPATAEEEPVKKKKSKAPKVPTTGEEDSQLVDGEATNNGLDQPATTKVKKTKKPKASKATTESYDDAWTDNKNEYTTNSGIYLNLYKLYLRVFFSHIIDVPHEFAELIEYLLA